MRPIFICIPGKWMFVTWGRLFASRSLKGTLWIMVSYSIGQRHHGIGRKPGLTEGDAGANAQNKYKKEHEVFSEQGGCTPIQLCLW